jgi:hypothetical protein
MLDHYLSLPHLDSTTTEALKELELVTAASTEPQYGIHSLNIGDING